jgi:uncharacterized protein
MKRKTLKFRGMNPELGLRKKMWSPYLAGALIGLLQIPAYLVARAFLGTSSSYARVAGHLFSWIGLKSERFAPFLHSHEIEWQLALVGGIAIGAYLSSRLSHSQKREPSPVWKYDYHQTGRLRRSLTALAGGFLLVFGARLAGGCTSGHGISGTAQFSLSSWITVSMMFAGGIGFTAILRRRAWRTSLSA